MKHTPWSISKADIATSCSLRYRLKYIAKNPGKPVERGDGRIGVAAHYILEHMIAGETYESAFRHAAIHNQLTYKEIIELKGMEPYIVRFLRKFTELKNKVTVEYVGTEVKLAIDKDNKSVDYWDASAVLRGIIDLAIIVVQNGKRLLLVVDHKSGTIKDISNYSMQLDSYLVMGRAKYENLDGVRSAIHWLQAEETLDQMPVQWEPVAQVETIDAVVAPRVHEYLSRAESAANAQPTSTRGWYCDFCEYKHLCPAFI